MGKFKIILADDFVLDVVIISVTSIGSFVARGVKATNEFFSPLSV
jgi:hypothetical protein